MIGSSVSEGGSEGGRGRGVRMRGRGRQRGRLKVGGCRTSSGGSSVGEREGVVVVEF